MNTFTVTISTRPLGILFGHFNQNINNKKQSVASLHQVLPGSHGFQIGLFAGDTLVAINNAPITHLSSTTALSTFRKQTLPFTASFTRKITPKPHTHIEGEGDCDIFTDDNDVQTFIKNNSDSLSHNSHKLFQRPTPSPSLSLNSYLSDSPSIYSHLSESLRSPNSINLQSPSPKYIPNLNFSANDFVVMDAALDEYYEMDQCTKYLIKGFLAQFQTRTIAPNLIEILTAKYVCNNSVCFDMRSENSSDDCEDQTKVITASSNGFKYGIHEWSLKILKCDVYRQEIGIVENLKDLQNIQCLKGGVGCTPKFGARAVYANALSNGRHYYGSYNDDNRVRCFKNIHKKIGWTAGDVIKTVLNLRKGSIQFFLNGEKVRKTLSIQKNKTFYPFLAFSGFCQYELIHFA